MAIPVLLFKTYGDNTPQDLVIGEWVIPLYSCQEHEKEVLKNRAWSWIGIDITFGQLSYSQAKMADLAFNWIAGRGFTALFTYMTYRVSLEAISRVAEVHYISYETFTSLALYSTKLDTLLQLLRGLLKSPGLRPRLMMAWLLLSTVYLAVLPSLFDIMTGYESYIQTELFLPGNKSMKITVDFIEEVLTSMKASENVDHNYTNSYFAATLYSSTVKTSRSLSLYSYHWFDETLDLSWNKYYNVTLLAESLGSLEQPYDAARPGGQQNHSTGFYIIEYYAMFDDRSEFYMSNPGNYVCATIPGIYQWGFSTEWVRLVVSINASWLLGLWIVLV